MKDPRLRKGPFEVNAFGCGCVIASELANGGGVKTIEYCALHAAAPELKKVAEMVLDANTATNTRTFTSKVSLACEYARAALKKANAGA